MEPTTALHRAIDQTSTIVAAIGDDQYDRPTPCNEFDVKALLNHTVASVQGLADAAEGTTWDMGAYGRDVLGDDPKQAPPDDQRPAEAFGPPVPVADDAPSTDRLAAFMGRTP